MIEPVTPTAKSLILDLLSTLKHGTMPVAALVRAAELFEIAENNVRVALARLLTAGLVERDERGQYRLGAGAAPVNRRVHDWRTIADRLHPWDEATWIGAHCPPGRMPERQRKVRERALRLLGLGELGADLYVRPDNVRGGAAWIRGELEALGLEAGARVFTVTDLDPATQAGARSLWDVSALCASYRQALQDLLESERRLQLASEEEAMVESFLLGGRVIRQMVLDPLLPEPILPTGEREQLIEALRRYDRLGRACWAAFMERHGVPTSRTPADTRFADGAGRMAVN